MSHLEINKPNFQIQNLSSELNSSDKGQNFDHLDEQDNDSRRAILKVEM